MIKNRPQNPLVMVVAIQRFFPDLHIVGLPCFTDRHGSVIAKSSSLLLSANPRVSYTHSTSIQYMQVYRATLHTLLPSDPLTPQENPFEFLSPTLSHPQARARPCRVLLHRAGRPRYTLY